MNIAIRMLKIITIILWVIIIFFAVTSVFSVINLGLTIGQVEMLPASNGITFSLPFTINNGGYYEIADLNLTTRVSDPDGTLIDQTETVIAAIPQGTNVTSAHEVSIDLETILSLDQSSLLLEDGDFNIEIFAGLNFARAIPVQLATNTTIPWGAPFAQFSVGSPSISAHNFTHREAAIHVTFENHAILDLAGILKLQFYDTSGQLVASGTNIISVGAGYSYDGTFFVYPMQQDVSKIAGSGTVHVIFETPVFTVEWDEQYG